MGFFSLTATCGVCGKEVGYNRYRIKKSDSWCCFDCFKRAGGVFAIDLDTVTIEDIKKRIDPNAKPDTYVSAREYRRKCNTCGFVFCFNDDDINRNQRNARMATTNSFGALANAVGGTQLGVYAQNNSAQNYLDKIVDFSRCPHCNSTDLKELTEEELRAEQAKSNNNGAVVSAADELKKFKELLDMGIITQEEFDAKKKQLLGL